ncbi:thiopeptide-type bacteriocin biosynthesis protein [Flavobacterium sp. IB48]|uniref:thiopeptide-type bacteriocin biosynthesis protein n=1 Tax=Flavobacterium sp. IB48 TaxID=2779375 RepID=UPI0018E7853E|nr:thiopeptide-type bacteriocin biosynthesis protein [Flavobacterium sp. IB48]MBJ2125978.1 thiopeptide-type bacteriocin biosynthesis protein [Flavobacterium sp. IB48]
MIFFDAIIKRATNFSVQSYSIHRNDVVDFFDANDLFQLSVLISSNSLYHDVKKNKRDKIESSLSKYYTRAHFNPTPFGLFSSVGLANWGTSTKLPKSKSIKLSITHDNLFLSLHQNSKLKADWKGLKYSINPSLHFLGSDKIGFYNSEAKKNDRIEINFVELDYDDNLEWLLEKFRESADIGRVINDLLLEGFDADEVEVYLLQLIDVGLLIENFLFNPYGKKLEASFPVYFSDLINKKSYYLHGSKDAKLFNDQYILEQDLFFKETENKRFSHSINSFDLQIGSVNSNIQPLIEKYIDFILSYNFNTKPVTGKINEFIAKVAENYNDGFIPLNSIFNPYSGIRYQDDNSDFILKLHQDIFCKIIASTEKELFLNLPGEANLDEKKKQLPLTFNVLIEILKSKDTGEEIVFMRGLGGGSAVDIISRFSEVNSELCREIIDYEKNANKNIILADVNCVGNFRSINISPKEQLYDYCIPINTSYAESKNPIFASDIYAYLESGKMRLVSKEHQKEIKPKKVSAINPKMSESELYKFLCDFEVYNEEIYGINFDFNAYSCFRDFVPRIYLESNILLAPAQILLVDNNYSFEEFKSYFLEKIRKFDFSRTVNFYYLKGNSIIDASKDEELKIIYDSLKTRDYCYVSENIYEQFHPAVENDSGNYAHELIVSVKNSHYKSEEFTRDIVINSAGNANIPLVSDWIYFEAYCNSYADNDILKSIYSELCTANKFTEFFFVHYDSNGRQLRLRFKTDSVDNKRDIINFVDNLKLRNMIKKYQILPYEPEIFRYGGSTLMRFAEFIFNLDSKDLIENVILKDLDSAEHSIVAMHKIINYLDLAGFTNDQMIHYCENCIENFSKEFKLTADLRKKFNEEYAKIRFSAETYNYTSFVNDAELKSRLSEELKQNTIPAASYIWLVIHMSMNRHFNEKQRFNEFKSYYLTKCYLNQLKFKNLAN